MGVMACNRTGCPHIMCDRYSPVFGCICTDCFEELVAMGPSEDVEEFMNSPPSIVKAKASEAYYAQVFPVVESSRIY